MAFEPSLTRAAAEGVASTRAPYPEGPGGIRISLEVMAQKMREGRLDPAISGWANGVLKQAGLDGRDGSSVVQQGTALLEALRGATIYKPDAYGAEVISTAAGTLCLRPNLCLNGGDCDDLSVALGSATLSLGIPTVIVKQTFGSDQQEHVLIAVEAENGEWYYADPSTRLPFGKAPNAAEEVWINPMEPIGNIGAASPEIVTLGAVGRRIVTVRHKATTTPHWGMGATPATATTPTPITAAPSSTPYQTITGTQIQAGLRYRIGLLVNLIGTIYNDPTEDGPARLQTDLTNILSQNFYIETLTPIPLATGGVQSWLMQGIAKQVTTLTSDEFITYQTIAVQAAPPTPAAGALTPVSPPALPTSAAPPSSGIGIGTALFAAGTVALWGGLWWGTHRRRAKAAR
jgi:hypothetical protein